MWTLTTLLFSAAKTEENFTAINNITQVIETTTEYVLPIDTSSILLIKFDLKDESVNQVASQIIYNATSTNITVNDLVELTQAETLNLTVINEALDQLDLTSTDLFDFGSLETAFTELNISALTVYRKLLDEFIPDPRQNVPRLLDTFEIDQSNFNDVILYGTDADLFTILKSANFSEENVQQAFNAILGKTPSDLYDFVKPLIFPRIRVYSIERLLEIVKKSELTPKHFEDVLDVFRVSRARYDEVPVFKASLNDYIKAINNLELYGTLVNWNNIATVNLVYNRYQHLKSVANMYVETIATPRINYKVANIEAYSDDCLYGPVIVNFEGNYKGRTIEITEDYPADNHHVHGCYYVVTTATGGGVLISEKLTHVHYKQFSLIADVSNTTEFKTGSPLICNNQLYGVAEDINKGRIGFRSFNCDGPSPDTTTIFADDPSVASTLVFIQAPAFIGLFVIQIFML